MPVHKEMRIREVSELFGVSMRALRFYERKGILKPRRDGHYRVFREDDLAKIELIKKGKRVGFTIIEIARMIGGDTTKLSCDLPLNQAQIDTQICRLVKKRDEVVSAIKILQESL